MGYLGSLGITIVLFPDCVYCIYPMVMSCCFPYHTAFRMCTFTLNEGCIAGCRIVVGVLASIDTIHHPCPEWSYAVNMVLGS